MPDNSESIFLIRQKALELGFSACGFSPAGLLAAEAERFRSWLEKGHAAEMDYLHRNADLRLDPRKLLPGAKTIVSLLARYSSGNTDSSNGPLKISRYARGRDYHKVLKNRSRELLTWVNENMGPAHGKVFCDSAPVMERSWAVRAGLGWIGRNGCLLVPGQGSWFFIAELILDLELYEYVQPVEDLCGSCRRCIEACPTGALLGDGTVDAANCIAYLTIEHRREIPERFLGKMNGWIFGCDICQEACPWNHFGGQTGISDLSPGAGREVLDPARILTMEEHEFERIFAGTAIRRTGLASMKRNILFAILKADEK